LALAGGRLGVSRLWWGSVSVLLVARATLAADVLPMTQLISASAGVVGGTVALMTLALDGRADRDARIGILAGVVSATCLHLATGTVGLVWPDSVSATVASLL